jgi:leucyl aminopeptidase
MTQSIPLHAVSANDYSAWLAQQPQLYKNWLAAQAFSVSAGAFTLLPGASGELEAALVIAESHDMYSLSAAAKSLPLANYQLHTTADAATQAKWMLGWQLGQDRFRRYLKPGGPMPILQPAAQIPDEIGIVADAVCAARAMVNTPAEDLGPEQLHQLVEVLSAEFALSHHARFNAIVGDELLAHNFPAIHAVGRASHRAPRLLQLTAGAADLPLIAIIGKGVCFDTGGLDMKPADGMALMKKDMGGSAVAVQLTRALLRSGIKARILLLVPAVENAVGPNAYRPGDVIKTRAGLSVEIGNTDAEGRVILCDALSYAQEQSPALMINFATLTGAARIALGPDLPALFSNDEALASGLLQAGVEQQDPLWRMPLWAPYAKMISSSIADMNNAGSSRMAGCITAALYLQRFVHAQTRWAHIDTYCWNDAEQAGRPKGGACQSLRAVYHYLMRHYG